MMYTFKRFLAMLLCLCMLPAAALCEGFGTTFRLDFDMNAAAYPEDVREVLSGIADLINAITLEGVFELQDGYFESDFDFLINDSERTRTPIRVYGDKANWIFRSPLLGNETVFLLMDGMLEFAMKGNAHMEIPAQRAATLISPYVHAHGVGDIWAVMKPVLFAKEGSRTISASKLKAMAKDVTVAADGRPFRYWAAAMARESGYEYEIRDALADAPAWLSSVLSSKGISVKVTDTRETWTTGKHTLFERTFSLEDAQTFKLTLPPSTNGYAITAEGAFQQSNGLFHGSIDVLIIDAWEGVVLELHANGTLPTAFPVTRSFSLTWDADGMAVGGEGVHLYFEGRGTGDTITLTQMTPDMEQAMFTLTLSGLEEIEASVEPYTDLGLCLMTVTSETLAELMRSIAIPMVKGLLPILAEAPASACQSILDLLEDSGIFGLVTDGLLSEDDWAEEDWEEWDEDEEVIW